tara:strand:+ start:462 stop:755 length:294 start_codon:yes stop_codon:yes gene_type:complete
MKNERLEHLTKDITLKNYIKSDCENLNRDKVRVRFYKTATTYSVFDMLVDKNVYEDYIEPSNINSKYVDKLEGKIFEKHEKLDHEYQSSMSSEIIEI